MWPPKIKFEFQLRRWTICQGERSSGTMLEIQKFNLGFIFIRGELYGVPYIIGMVLERNT